MAKKFNKDELFEDFSRSTIEAFTLMEPLFGVNILTSFFGLGEEELNTPEGAEKATQLCRQSPAGVGLNELYDYSVNGILDDGSCPDPMDRAVEVVIGGAEILSLITTENSGPSEKWDQIVALGDGRYGLDIGEDIEIKKLALLADIDQRTVRNAVSAGELDAIKVSGSTVILNKSALKWLASRRGYTPTRFIAATDKILCNITSATELGAYLMQRRESLNLKLHVNTHPALNTKALSELELGQFTLSLDEVYQLADFYNLDSGELLETVMLTFYSEQFKTLIERNC